MSNARHVRNGRSFFKHWCQRAPAPSCGAAGGGGSGACSTPGPPEGVRGSACSGHRCAGSGRPHPTRTGHPEPRRSPGKQVQSTHEHERRLRPEDAGWRPRRAHECTSPCHGSPLRLLLPRPAGTATPKPPPRVLTSPLLPGGAALAAGDSEGWCVAGAGQGRSRKPGPGAALRAGRHVAGAPRTPAALRSQSKCKVQPSARGQQSLGFRKTELRGPRPGSETRTRRLNTDGRFASASPWHRRAPASAPRGDTWPLEGCSRPQAHGPSDCG